MAPKRVHLSLSEKNARRVWRYQRGNQNPYIEEKQITQWPEEKVQKDKQRSTKHTYKTKDRVTRTPLKTGGELRCSGRVSSSCSTSGTRRINLVTNLVISRERGKKIYYSEEKFEDVKCVIRRSKNDMQYNDLKKKLSTKGQTTIYKTLHRKLKIEQR
jgi:hypothetical protein